MVNRQHGGKENLEKLGYRVHALATITEIVDSLSQDEHISKEQAEKVSEYVKSFQVF